ncbi:hypothetical protein HDU97_000258 [Phlyctochytrium planicorne]|nr:hypothetical protein HDU97_000258 [Phlyctochytrium planicorne]
MSSGTQPNKVQNVQAEIDDVVNIMNERLNATTNEFSSRTKEVRRKMFWKDAKTRMILIAAFIILVLVIIGISFWSSKGFKGNDNGQQKAPIPTQTP